MVNCQIFSALGRWCIRHTCGLNKWDAWRLPGRATAKNRHSAAVSQCVASASTKTGGMLWASETRRAAKHTADPSRLALHVVTLHKDLSLQAINGSSEEALLALVDQLSMVTISW